MVTYEWDHVVASNPLASRAQDRNGLNSIYQIVAEALFKGWMFKTPADGNEA
jgi:hypothetical protein